LKNLKKKKEFATSNTSTISRKSTTNSTISRITRSCIARRRNTGNMTRSTTNRQQVKHNKMKKKIKLGKNDE
jgi:hypothetical protein